MRCGLDGIVYHLIEEALRQHLYVTKESWGRTAIDTRCSNSDNLHFDAAGCIDAASRMFDKLVSLGLLEDEDPTGTASFLPSPKGKSDVFDLSGRKIANSKQSGIRIKDGRKVLVGSRLP